MRLDSVADLRLAPDRLSRNTSPAVRVEPYQDERHSRSSDRAAGDMVLLADGSALVCWMGGGARECGADKVRRVAPDGTLGAVAISAPADVSRVSGFPRMVRLGNTVYFAWTQFGKPSRVPHGDRRRERLQVITGGTEDKLIYDAA